MELTLRQGEHKDGKNGKSRNKMKNADLRGDNIKEILFRIWSDCEGDISEISKTAPIFRSEGKKK